MKHHLRHAISVILVGLLSFQSAAPGFAEPGVVGMHRISNRFNEEALAPQDLSSTHLADTNPVRGRRPILSRLLRSKMAIGSSLALLSPLRAFAESFKQTATGAKVVFGTWDPAHPAAETAGHAAVKSLKALGVKPLSGHVYSWSQIQDFLNTHMPGYQSAQSSADGVDIVGLSKDQVLKLPNVEPLPHAPAPVATPSPIPTPTHISIHHASWLNSHWSGLQHFVVSHPWEIVAVVLASLVAVYLVHRLLPKDSIQGGRRLAFIGLGGVGCGALAILAFLMPGMVVLTVGTSLLGTFVIGLLTRQTPVSHARVPSVESPKKSAPKAIFDRPDAVIPEAGVERQLSIEELENLGIEEILRNPDLILPYLSDRLQRDGVRQYPMDSLEDEPARAFEYLIALAEGGIGPVLRGETSARFYPSSGMTGIREATLAFSRREGDTDETVRRVVKVTPAYGGTDHFLEDVKSSNPERGLQVDPVNLSSNREEFYANLERVLGPDTRLVVLEAATNPSLEIPDLPRIRRIVDGARRRFGTEIYIVVDNAFATSRGVRPLEQGADVSVSVPTKAETAGAAPSSVVVARSELIRRLPPLNPRSRAVDNAVAEDGLWPLRLSPERYRKVSENAEVVARWLEDRSQENDSIILPDSVRYPKFPTHPDSAVVEREGMSGGHMIYFQMTTDAEAENFIKLLRFFRLFGHAVSLGKVISLAELPAFGTHSGMTPAQRKAAGIQSAGVRFTIGLEDPQDVIRELDAIFKILKRFRRFFWLIPYRKLDQALMAPYRTASGQTAYLVRSNPVWDKGAARRETRWSLNPVFIWVRGIILQATDWDSYRVESLLQRNFWWNHASGNHSALYPTMETGATSAGHPTPSDLGQGFQANIKSGQPPHRYYGLYGRAGSYIEGQLAFNITAGLHGYKAAMRQEWFGVSFMSVKEAKAVLDLPRVQKRLQETPGFDVVPVVLFGQELGAVVVARPEVAALLANSHMEGLSAAMPPKAVKKGFIWFQNHVLKLIPTFPVLSSLEDVEDYLAHPVAELPERPFLSPDGSFVERRLPRRGVRPAFANALVAAA